MSVINNEGAIRSETAKSSETVEKLMHLAPAGVVGLIAQESLAVVGQNQGVDFSGVIPRGETLAQVRHVLDKASLVQDQNGQPRVVDLTQVDGVQLSTTVADKVKMFKVQRGRGFDFSATELVQQDLLTEETKKGLWSLSGFDANRLLIGLWAAGFDSNIDRKGAGARPQTVDVKYFHSKSGEVTLIKMNTFVASALAHAAEEAILDSRGKL